MVEIIVSELITMVCANKWDILQKEVLIIMKELCYAVRHGKR
jgi:hypothetical protein